MLALILFPGVGLAFYLVFGRNWRTIGTRDRVRVEAKRLAREALGAVLRALARRGFRADRTDTRSSQAHRHSDRVPEWDAAAPV
jgi:hypothetical protein